MVLGEKSLPRAGDQVFQQDRWSSCGHEAFRDVARRETMRIYKPITVYDPNLPKSKYSIIRSA